MLLRTFSNALQAAQTLHNSGFKDTHCVVATDDERIEQFCHGHELPCVMTDSAIRTGSDRALTAADRLDPKKTRFKFIINLQGDAPFTPAAHIDAVARGLVRDGADAATPYVQLDWAALDQLRAHKQTVPFSGTTLIEDEAGFAVWFSKAILPAIRDEERLRKTMPLSPVKRHIGLYGYRREALTAFAACPPSHYETLEGLEQLRLLETGRKIACMRVESPLISLGGIDTQADIDLAERLLAEWGDPYRSLST